MLTDRRLQAKRPTRDGVFPPGLGRRRARGCHPDDEDASGLQAAIKGRRAATTQLTDIQQIIDADTNLLGFAPDFLMLIENFEEESRYDAFNVFAERLDLIRPASFLTMAQTIPEETRSSILNVELRRHKFHSQLRRRHV